MSERGVTFVLKTIVDPSNRAVLASFGKEVESIQDKAASATVEHSRQAVAIAASEARVVMATKTDHVVKTVALASQEAKAVSTIKTASIASIATKQKDASKANDVLAELALDAEKARLRISEREVDRHIEAVRKKRQAEFDKQAKQAKQATESSGGGKPGSTLGSGIGNELKTTLGQYVGMAAAFVGVKKSLSLAAEAEQQKISLEVMTGSAEKAKMLYEGFRELDRSSPLASEDFSRAAKTLIGYGYAAEKTLPSLRKISEVSVGNRQNFQSLTLAYGQVVASGKLMGQEVRQMINAGFNPLLEISRKTGRSMGDLKSDMEEGAISSKMLEDAFESATAKGGRFYDMNEKLKNSASGQWAQITSDVNKLAIDIGTQLMPAVKEVMALLASGGDGGVLSSLAGAFSTGVQGAIALGKDMFTNLDRRGTDGQEVNKLLERTQNAQLTKDMTKAFVHVNTPEENARIQSNLSRRAYAERERERLKEAYAPMSAEKQAKVKLETGTVDQKRKVIEEEIAKNTRMALTGNQGARDKIITWMEKRLSIEKDIAKEAKHAATEALQASQRQLKDIEQQIAKRRESTMSARESFGLKSEEEQAEIIDIKRRVDRGENVTGEEARKIKGFTETTDKQVSAIGNRLATKAGFGVFDKENASEDKKLSAIKKQIELQVQQETQVIVKIDRDIAEDAKTTGEIIAKILKGQDSDFVKAVVEFMAQQKQLNKGFTNRTGTNI
jgi:tape measure domain-containing protein